MKLLILCTADIFAIILGFLLARWFYGEADSKLMMIIFALTLWATHCVAFCIGAAWALFGDGEERL